MSILRFSDTGFITGPNDDPANSYYEGRARNPLVLLRRIALSPESSIDGIQTGDIELENQDGALDNILAENAIDGQDVRILIGRTSDSYADFVEVYRGVGAGWSGGDRIKIAVRDSSFMLELPVQPNTYAGTGTAEGDTELKGRRIPVTVGQANNVTPVLIDRVKLIYQYHDGSVNALSAVYDQGKVIALDTDTTDLWAGSTTAGKHRSDVVDGLFQLGSSPAGEITCDVRGNNTGGYVNTVAECALRLLRGHTGIGRRFIDEGSFASLAVTVAGVAGYHVSGRETAREVLSILMRGIGAYWFMRRDGRIRVQRLAEPEIFGELLRLGVNDILSLEQVQLPPSIFPPNFRRTIGYEKNWTVQTSDYEGTISDARQLFLAREWATTAASDTSVQTKHPNATDPPLVPSHLENKADADTLASFLLDLHGAERQMLEITLGPPGFEIDMGDTILVTWPRYGLGSGKLFRAFPVRDDFQKRRVTLRCWG